ENETTASGIIIPDTAKEKPERGSVVAVGPGKVENGQRVAMEVKPGDTIMFKKYAPDEFKVNGERVFVIESRDVIAVIE
ncbi:co-chaperone GroES, partial [Candidatus Uhrbacteria bacterium RIFCSPLOWO2_01_FULL_53_9]